MVLLMTVVMIILLVMVIVIAMPASKTIEQKRFLSDNGYFSSYFSVRPRIHLNRLAEREESGEIDLDYDFGNLQLLKFISQHKKGSSHHHRQAEITRIYRFQLGEQEMYDYIYKTNMNSDQKNKDAFSQLECLECLKLTNKMLE